MVLASPFDVNTASSYGVIICEGAGPVQRMRGLVERPGRTEACQPLAEHGACSLRFLQGRMRITPDLLSCLRSHPIPTAISLRRPLIISMV